MMPDDVEQNKLGLERTKLAIDCVKHITTLATGIIVFSAAMLDKIPAGMNFKELLLISLSLIVISLLSCFALIFLEGVQPIWQEGKFAYPVAARWGTIVIGFVIYLSFPAGLFTLGIFAFANFYSK
jgi:hypothetical protein